MVTGVYNVRRHDIAVWSRAPTVESQQRLTSAQAIDSVPTAYFLLFDVKLVLFVRSLADLAPWLA